MALHADSITQNRAAGKRTGRINGQHTDGFILFSQLGDQRVSQSALARAGRSGYPDDE
jgi:hypothetical protein